MSERSYTLFMHDGSGIPPAFEVELFPNFEVARVRALELLLQRPRYHSVEISDGLSSIHVERPHESPP